MHSYPLVFVFLSSMVSSDAYSVTWRAPPHTARRGHVAAPRAAIQARAKGLPPVPKGVIRSLFVGVGYDSEADYRRYIGARNEALYKEADPELKAKTIEHCKEVRALNVRWDQMKLDGRTREAIAEKKAYTEANEAYCERIRADAKKRQAALEGSGLPRISSSKACTVMLLRLCSRADRSHLLSAVLRTALACRAQTPERLLDLRRSLAMYCDLRVCIVRLSCLSDLRVCIV